ncbi:hypothetical protein HYT55_02920 [Candidatus Woesearchaeota archaeon]|nr:hypothetical protein [Candidatus Woesearchaeota archaeon]
MAKRKKSRQNRRKVSSAKRSSSSWHATPLKGSFMATSIIGFFITAYLVYPTNPDYGVAFMVVFIAMFIASLISMTKAPVVE